MKSSSVVDVREDEADRIVELVGDAGHQLTDRGHLLALDELHLSGLQIAVRAPQLLVGRPELLGAHPDLVLEGPRRSSIVRKLSALSIASATWLATVARRSTSPRTNRPGSDALTRQDAEDLVAHAQGYRDEGAHPMGARQSGG